MNQPGAVVVGGDYRGLGIVRSLGRRGIPVWVAQGDDRLAGASRYATRRLRWPDGDDAEQIRFLREVADGSDLNGWVLFPTSDTTASLVSRHYDELSDRYRLTTSAWPVYSRAQDKRAAYACAEALGIAIPRTWYATSRSDVEALDVPFPVILKPASGEHPNAFTKAKAWRVDTRDELLLRSAEARELMGPGEVLIQELIPGGGECQLSFAGLCRDGEVLAFLTARRLRQIPADFGRASTFVETTDRRDVQERAERLLRELRLSGLVEVEFKQDPRNGEIKLLDVNARVWGWHSLGASAGVDFPYLAWLLAQGHDVPRVQGRAGVQWLRLSMDLAATIPEVTARRTSVREYVRSLRGADEGPMAAADDRMPAVVEVPLLAWRTVHRVATRVLPRRGLPRSRPVARPTEVDADADVIVGYSPSRLVAEPLAIGAGARLRSGSVLYDGSQVGERLQTGHNVTIREESEIGDDVSIWSNSVIDYGCRIGNRVKIHSNCYVAQFSVIEDDAFLAPGVVLANDLYPGHAASAELMAGPYIEKGAQLGVNVTVLPYVRIGAGAMVGAGSVVTKDVPAGAVVRGNPAVVTGTCEELGDVARRVRDRAGRSLLGRTEGDGFDSRERRTEARTVTSLIHVDPTTHTAWKDLTATSHASIFMSPQWIDTVGETYGFDVGATVLCDADSRPIAGLACAELHDLRGARQVSLPFCDYADPIVDTDDQWDALIAPYMARGVPVHVRVLDAQSPRRDARFEQVDELAWHSTDLEGDEADLLARMHPQFRQALRASQRHGVTTRFGTDLDDVRAYYDLHCFTRMRKYRLLPQPWSFFENLWKRFAPVDGIAIGLAGHDGDVVAGALYLVWRGVIYYKFGGSIAERLTVRPNEMLAWQSMLLGRELGCTKYDWGVSDLDQPGLIRFKRKCATDERRVAVLRHTPAGYEPPGYTDEADTTLSALTRTLTSEDVPSPVAQRAADILYHFFAR